MPLLRGASGVVRAMRSTADEALRPLERRMGQRGQADHGPSRQQTAAE